MAVTTPVPDLQHVAALIRRETDGLADVLEGLSPEQWHVPACGDWTIDQVCGHLGIVPSSIESWYEAAIAGEEVEPIDLRDPEFQETQLEMIGEADTEDRIAGLRYAYLAAADYLEGIDAASIELPTYTPEGILPLRVAARISLSELFVHGFDIRRGAGLDVRGDVEVATALLPHSLAVLPAFLTRARDWGGALAIVAGDGRWTVTPTATGVAITEGDAGGAGATLRIDPRDLVLLVWGRIGLADAGERGATVEGDATIPQRLLDHLDPM